MKTIYQIILSASILYSPLVQSYSGNPENILGYVTDEAGIIFQVPSGGCTDRKSFVIKQARVDSVRLISLERVRPDACLALFPHGIKFRVTYDELRIQMNERFRVQNELSVLTR